MADICSVTHSLGSKVGLAKELAWLALSLAIGRHARDSPYFVWSIEGKWESGGEAGEKERNGRKSRRREQGRDR